MVKVDVIDSIDRLKSFRESWNGVLEKNPDACIYLTCDWFITWWRHFGNGKELFIIIVSRDGQVEAILPLFRTRSSYFGLPITKIGFISNEYTPFCEAIATDGAEESLLTAFEYLRKVRWDVLELGAIPARSETLRILDQVSHKGIFIVHKGADELKNPHVAFDVTWAEYHKSLPDRFRKNLGRAEKNLNQMGKVTLEEINRSPDLDVYLRKAFAIESSGWKGAQKTALIYVENAKNFYTELAHVASENGWLRLFFLKFNENHIAFDYDLQYQGNIESIKIGYDESYSKYSPGSLLSKKILQKVFAEGPTRYNFRGKYIGHKRNWTKSAEMYNDIWVFKRSSYQYLIYLMQFGIKKYLKKFTVLMKVKKRIFGLLSKKERIAYD